MAHLRDAAPQPGQVRFPDRLRLPFDFDPVPLARDLAALSDAGWTEHFVKQNYDGDWSVIPLRAPAGESHPVRMIYPDPAAREFVDTPLLARAPTMRSVLAAFKCPLQCARLMRLAPGSIIREHRDSDLAFEYGDVRLHIPIRTNPGVKFLLNGSRVVMEPGSVWYLRLSDPHSVANEGASDRVHLVIDLSANAWLEAVLDQSTPC